MFISRKTYDDLRLDATKCREEARVLDAQNRTLTTSLGWMQLRCNQMEKERALMTYHYTGVKVEVPEVVATPKKVENILGAAMHFDDIGDEMAKALGITHNEDGSLCYAKAAV